MGGSLRDYDAYEKRGINAKPKNEPPPPKAPPGGIKPNTNQTQKNNK